MTLRLPNSPQLAGRTCLRDEGPFATRPDAHHDAVAHARVRKSTGYVPDCALCLALEAYVRRITTPDAPAPRTVPAQVGPREITDEELRFLA